MIRRTKTSKLEKTQKKEATIMDNISDSETFDDKLDKNETVNFDLFNLEKSLKTDIIGNINARNQENEDASTLNKKCTKEEKGWIDLIRTKTSKLDNTQKNKTTKDNILYSATFDNELEMNETVGFDLFDLEKNLETDIIHNINTSRNQENEDASTLNTSHITFDLFLIILSLLLLLIKLLYEKVLMLEGTINEMENEKSNLTGSRYCLARTAHF